MRNKILSLLVLLLTAASGAWAQETPLVTITFDSNGPVYSVEGLVTLTGTNYHLGNSSGVYFWEPNSPTKTLSATVEAVADNVSISKVVFRSINDIPLEDTEKPFVCYANYDLGGRSLSETDWTNKIASERIAKIEVYAPAAEASLTVDWDATTKTGTFSMPGSDVVLTPQYAPVAKWDVVETVEQKPAALEGIIAGQDAAIVTAGQSAQGTVMYAVTTTAEAAPALTAFSATVPNAKDYDDATTVYVWYYIQGHDTPDGQQATEDNTFNDSEISATPLKVDILTNKFDLTLKPAPVKNMTVTVAGQAKTPTDEGKLTGVKMESEVKLKAATGYKFRKVEVKKGAEAKPIALSEVTADYLGSVVCSDGNVYPAKTAVPDGCTAVGILGKVTETGHGLILSLQDATNQNCNTINGWTSASYAGTTLKVLPDDAARGTNLTSYTTLGETTVSNWAVAQQSDYEAIFTNLGSMTGDGVGKTYDGNVNAFITTGVGGTEISGNYWSATEDGVIGAWSFNSDFWSRSGKSNSISVRPVLGF